MITLQQALDDQKDLDALCSPKNENRFERYPPNDNYGFAHAMKTYAGYPVRESINATFPHGIYMQDRVVPVSELNAKYKTHLNFPPSNMAAWKKAAKNKKIVPFASPIHYILKQFVNEVSKSDRKGTLFVPSHSSDSIYAKFDRESVVKELRDLPEEFHPITLCVHWSDVKRGQHLEFKKLGFDVVCAGHLTDYRFVFRWLHLASQFKLLAGCGISSSLFYSTLLGIPYYLTEEDVEYQVSTNFEQFNKKGNANSPQGLKKIQSIKSLFSSPSTEVSQEQLDLVSFYTNKSLTKSPSNLLKLFQSLK
jgi:hypothetical protein